MRVSTSYMHQSAIDAILKQQSKLSETQTQVSTGEKIQSSADDPIAAVKSLGLNRELNLTKQYLANADTADTKLINTDSVLSSATDILQRIRELAVKGLSDTNDAQARQAIASEMTELNETLVGLANSEDSNGEYIFSGYQTGTEAFDATTFAYNGDSGQRSIRIADSYSVEINESGDDVFISTTVGGTTQSVFQTIQDFTNALNSGTVGTAPNDGDFLSNMDTSMDLVAIARTRIGAQQNAIEQQRSVNEDIKFNLESTLSDLEALDYAEAISLLSLQSTALEASQASYVKVQSLSLFNYL
ncbi:MAG: flagellar hook-associated protein 3 [Gammaproteobacteria bacterium]|nr:MAG: flagellar hook-associated protein 3 [Gammaproteobacteria bacterium]